MKFAVRALTPILLTGLALLAARPASAQTGQAATPSPLVVKPCSAAEREAVDDHNAKLVAAAQTPEARAAVVPLKMAVPPAGSPTLYRCATPVFHPTGDSIIDPETYIYYIKYLPSDLISNPATPKWVPYRQDAVLGDFNSLMKTGFLDNLWVEEIDEPFDNGVLGIHVIFHMEERQRLKGVDYLGSKKVEVSKIEEAMKTKGVALQVDSFLDPGNIRRVKGIVQELYAEKGYQAAKVTADVKPLEGSTKLVRLVFNIDEGPAIKIKQIVWDGNQAFSDKALTGQIKDNKPIGWLSWLTQGGSYQEVKFADDAQRVTEFYQDRGYTQARIGAPQVEVISDSKDGKQRYIRLRIPIDEGQPYHIGKMTIAGNTVFKPEPLLTVFKLKEGDLVSRKKLIKGLEEIKKTYGMFGYWESNPIPDLCFRGTDCDTGKPLAPGKLPDIVDITFQMNEGKQFFVNTITFLGNTTTHDTVIRRELRVSEGGVFNSENLKDSIKRLNQLGYFKPVEKPEDMDVQPSKIVPDHVDIRLRFEEQNRNQLSFGAGVSQYEGVFGQLGFQTSNFLGRGETLGINLQKGSQAKNYQLSVSEPWVFDRPITAGMDVYARQYIFLSQYTEDETGGDIVVSMPLGGYRRLSIGYGYTQIGIHDIGPAYAGLLTDTRYDISKITPTFIYNTVNQPIFPSSGTRYTASVGVAGLGGTFSFVTTSLDGIWYKKLTNRMSFGLHVQSQFSEPYGSTKVLPVSERTYLGGEYTIRGFDIRSIGPRDASSGVVLGGNKTLVFNAEYYINIMGPVRFLVFYDAGEVRDLGQPFVLKDPLLKLVSPTPPTLTDNSNGVLTFPGAPPSTIETFGYASAIKTSTGAELRFFMPVLNLPFRLIAAYNPQRYGVLNNKLLPTSKFTFRFAVGTTF